MTRNYLMVGISALAFAAGAADAQTARTTNGTYSDSNGNNVYVGCAQNASNVCSVDQGANGTTFSSTGAAYANGSNSTATVTQSGNRQNGQISSSGSYNSASVSQGAFSNTASVTQSGSGGSTAGGNVTSVTQGNGTTGSNNQAYVGQTRTSGAADSAGANAITIAQGTVAGGFSNTATASQNGTNLTSTIAQTAASGDTVSSNNNSASVTQSGQGSSSTVTQRRSGNVATVNMFGGNNTANTASTPVTGANISSITQTNTQFQNGSSAGTYNAVAPSTSNSPTTGNTVNLGISGFQNNSAISQDGVQNSVDQSLLNGGTGNTSQTGAGGTNPGTGAAVAANRPQGNSSTITQSGRGNYAATSIGGQVTTGGGAGNISSISQTQGDATVGQTTLNSTMAANTAHRALVYQRGILDQVAITQTNNSNGVNGATQSGSLADVSQLSYNSTTTVTQSGSNTAQVTQGAKNETTGASDQIAIVQTDAGDTTTQNNSSTPGGTFGGGSSSSSTTTNSLRNYVQAVQYGITNTQAVNQNAINASATVYQAVGTRSNAINVQQGSQATPGSGTNVNQVAGLSTQQQSSQFATANNTTGTQNVTATAYQTAGQAGTGTFTNANGGAQAYGITIAQSGANLTATANQSGGTAATAGGTTGGTSSNNSILIAQANGSTGVGYAVATVNQSGTGLVATVEQRGGYATSANPNKVTINQSNANNVALARQTNNSGATTGAGGSTEPNGGVPGDANFPSSRSGSSVNSAEIAIMQSGTGGSATVEQRGRGQYASLTQSGTNNVGGILQDVNATNAVAVLNQSGTGNTYYINQTTAGQYANVSQTGSGNALTTNVNGPSGNGGGTGTAPTFGGTQ